MFFFNAEAGTAARGRIVYLFTAAIVLSVGAWTSAPDASAQNPTGAYFTAVTANGAGCPPGTWEGAISPDGKAFTVTFSAYEAVIEPGQAVQEKDCTLSLNVHTPRGTSFSSSKISYQGYALLNQARMRALESARYDFRGAVLDESVHSQSGPFDDAYFFSDRILLSDFVWSSGGADRALNVKTRLVLRNNLARTGSGYLNTNSVEGTIE